MNQKLNNNKIDKIIKRIVEESMNKVMERVLITDPFIKEKHYFTKPIYASLIPDEIFKGSHFERRFVTSFGTIWEKLAQAIAIETHGNCSKGHIIVGEIGSKSLHRIQEILDNLEHKKGVNPNWESEIKYILDGRGKAIETTIVCDLFIDSQTTGMKYAFEIKTPFPNSDQTKVSKEKMFKLFAMKPKKVDFTFFALPYNPYGNKEDYNWKFPFRWFDMNNDKSVLIGKEFWELIGGDGTYNKLLYQINILGKKYKKRIYTEYLGIKPPKF